MSRATELLKEFRLRASMWQVATFGSREEWEAAQKALEAAETLDQLLCEGETPPSQWPLNISREVITAALLKMEGPRLLANGTGRVDAEEFAVQFSERLAQAWREQQTSEGKTE